MRAPAIPPYSMQQQPDGIQNARAGLVYPVAYL